MFMIRSQSVLGKSLGQQSSVVVSMIRLVSKTVKKEKNITYISLANVEI